MKLVALLSLGLILSTAAMSQINKGQFLTGGNISFEAIKSEGPDNVNYKTSQFFISPDIGYFIIPKLAGGLRADAQLYKQRTPPTTTQTYISISPFLRYYLLPVWQKFNILMDIGYVHYTTKFRSPSSTEAYIQKYYGYNIATGPAIFLNEHVSLELLLSYKSIKDKETGNNKTNTFNTRLGLQVHLSKIKTKSKA